MFHKQYCLLKLLNLGALLESSPASLVFVAASHPPTHPTFPHSHHFGILRPNYYHGKFLKNMGVVPGFKMKLKGLDATLLILSGLGDGVWGLDPAKGSLPTGKPVNHASYIFREASSNLRTSVTVCNIFSPRFYSKLTKDTRPTHTDSVTYLGIIEQTSVRLPSWSRVSMNGKCASALIIADRLCDSPADSVGNSAPRYGGSSPTLNALFSGRQNNEGVFWSLCLFSPSKQEFHDQCNTPCQHTRNVNGFNMLGNMPRAYFFTA